MTFLNILRQTVCAGWLHWPQVAKIKNIKKQNKYQLSKYKITEGNCRRGDTPDHQRDYQPSWNRNSVSHYQHSNRHREHGRSAAENWPPAMHRTSHPNDFPFPENTLFEKSDTPLPSFLPLPAFQISRLSLPNHQCSCP